MQLNSNYWWFDRAISPETCQNIIKLGTTQITEREASGRPTEAWTFGDTQKSGLPDSSPQGEHSLQHLKNQGISKPYARDSNIAWLRDQWLYDLFTPYIAEANKNAGWNWEYDYHETFQFTVYKPGQFYSWHKDGMSDHPGAYKRYLYGMTNTPMKANGLPPSGYTLDSNMVGKIRKISMTCNLNVPSDYEGGNLKFDFGVHTDQEQFHECNEIRPQGSIIVFPSFVDHCVTPVTTGVRYSLVLWTLGHPFK